ncbi:hypothetical protein [Luteibacter sp. UNCMF366Tsu5.1]|uniref:hypothetical protein n=1 Tax=Luteibacter sp. UNCMF366Tsu5.1 TaxID=1502758 RepID=UPI00090898C1|nr:hypothetical protein [Luteibacter sp. UNCMF366Tsu5.1]SFW24413.1 hypothetical protein SAMN02800691_0496 [Luteibacter sp. UNCMF366Tsu5.1]
MSQRHDIIRLLSETMPYRPLKNPGQKEQAEKRIERAAAHVFALGFATMLILWAVRFATGPLPGWIKWSGLAFAVASIIAGFTYSSADLIVRCMRRAHRAEDEAHHQLARLDHRTPQVEALAVFDDDALEDVEAQYRARLDASQSRMASVLGDKSAVVTSALSMVTLWKVLSDLKWVEPGSPILGAFIGAGVVIAIVPALAKGFSERLVYQCDLLASARKSKARQGGDGEGQTRLTTQAANDGAVPLPDRTARDVVVH